MPGSRRKPTSKTDEVIDRIAEAGVQEVPPEETPEQSVEVTPDAPAEVVTHDEEDVRAALARDTQDGKGDEPAPESDFESYATKGVEKTLSVQEVASEILQGKWGSYAERRKRLQNSGYDPVQVESEVNLRMSSGAPYAYRSSVTEVATQVIRGEWGSEREQRLRLEGAGHLHRYVMDEVTRLQGG